MNDSLKSELDVAYRELTRRLAAEGLVPAVDLDGFIDGYAGSGYASVDEYLDAMAARERDAATGLNELIAQNESDAAEYARTNDFVPFAVGACVVAAFLMALALRLMGMRKIKDLASVRCVLVVYGIVWILCVAYFYVAALCLGGFTGYHFLYYLTAVYYILLPVGSFVSSGVVAYRSAVRPYFVLVPIGFACSYALGLYLTVVPVAANLAVYLVPFVSSALGLAAGRLVRSRYAA